MRISEGTEIFRDFLETFKERRIVGKVGKRTLAVARSIARCADNADLAFFNLADAASFRNCGISFLAAERKPPLRSFEGIDFTRPDTALSPQVIRASKVWNEPDWAA